MSDQSITDLCSINPESLGVGTTANFSFDYIDISSVTRGQIAWSEVQRVAYKDAPSRARRRLRAGDVLLCTVRPALQSHARIASENGSPQVGSTGFAVLRPNLASDSSYIFQQLFADSVAAQLRAMETGSNYPAVNERDVARLRVFAPGADERRRIAAVLDTADAAIDAMAAVIEKLKQVRAGLLHDLLTRGLDDNGEFRDPIKHPDQFKDSPLGRMPKNWEPVRLGSCAERIQDGTHYSPRSTRGPRRYITSKNIRFGYMSLDNCGWISEPEHRAIFKRCDVRVNDVLLTKDGANTGNAALNTLTEEFSLLSSVALIRCREGASHYGYILYYLLSELGQKRLKDMMAGNAITRLTLQKIRDFCIPLPQFNEQEQIALRIKQFNDRLNQEESEARKLRLLKSGVASDLLTGRLPAPESIGTEITT